MYPQNSDEMNNEYVRGSENEAGMYVSTEENYTADAEVNTEYTEQTEEKEKDNIRVCDGLVKIYKTDDVEVLALQGLELEIERGELVAALDGQLRAADLPEDHVDGHDKYRCKACGHADIVQSADKLTERVANLFQGNLPFPERCDYQLNSALYFSTRVLAWS